VKLEYRPAPTLRSFLASDAFARVVVGPFGSGKSVACTMELPRRARGQAPDKDGIRRTRFAVVRNTRPQLRDTTRKTVDAWVGSMGKWREDPMELRIKAGDVDCEILFRALDRPEDVRNLLSLELTGCWFNEVREISKPIWDGMDGRVGRYPDRKHGPGATWWGIWGDTNPWHNGHWGDKLFSARLPGYSLFRQPGGRAAGAENLENLRPGYYEHLALGKDSEYIRVYIDGLNGSSDMGSIFGRWLDRLQPTDFRHPTHDIFTSWDIGLGDSMAIWWWRLCANGVEVLDWYQNQGLGLEHYWDELEKREKDYDWKHLRHWLPHDAASRELSSGTSVLARFLERYGTGLLAVGPRQHPPDGISMGRWLLEQPGTKFHVRAAPGFEVLREYQFGWDADSRTFSTYPLHNWASHTGDAWRYVAGVVKASELLTRVAKPAEPKLGPMVRPDGKLDRTLDELWDMHERRGR
jgi:hypothetical protein